MGELMPGGGVSAVIWVEHLVEIPEGEEAFILDNARALSPRGNSENLEKMRQDARDQLLQVIPPDILVLILVQCWQSLLTALLLNNSATETRRNLATSSPRYSIGSRQSGRSMTNLRALTGVCKRLLAIWCRGRSSWLSDRNQWGETGPACHCHLVLSSQRVPSKQKVRRDGFVVYSTIRYENGQAIPRSTRHYSGLGNTRFQKVNWFA
jgi:hypothetical protein